MTDQKSTSVEPELVILSTPQISVTLNQYDEIEIDTSFIGADFESVEHGNVTIPLSKAEAVANALMAILRSREG